MPYLEVDLKQVWINTIQDFLSLLRVREEQDLMAKTWVRSGVLWLTVVSTSVRENWTSGLRHSSVKNDTKNIAEIKYSTEHSLSID